jgi:5' nucleotidase, deoxy (Pyrimidine), cytosolic type C protein (NT5C)
LIGAAPVIAANAVSIVVVSAVTIRKMAAVRVSGGGHQRLRIAIDMDEVMADALAEHVRRYNAAFGATLAVADLRGHHLEDWIAPAEREAVEAMLDASFFTNLSVMPDCHEVPLAAAAFPIHPGVADRLLWRQGCHRRGLPDRRSRAPFRALQGAPAALLGAAQCARVPLPARRLVEGCARGLRAPRSAEATALAVARRRRAGCCGLVTALPVSQPQYKAASR